MLKPLIGITTSRLNRNSQPPAFGTNIAYIEAIADAGGIPVLIPSNLTPGDLDNLLPKLAGILFTGGSDIAPQRYGNPPHPKVAGVDSDRDRVEIQLVQGVISLGKPFLGICRGCQVINVALGGTLYEDLSDQHPGYFQHDYHNRPRNYLAHPVMLASNSRLAGILTENPSQVNSLHHQGLKRLASDLKSVAYSPDDLVEAVELPSHAFGLAVQWHPEELQNHEPMRKLFQAFIQACQSKE